VHVGVAPINEKMRKGHFRWCGHMQWRKINVLDY
jgi:hypothetical protein